VIHGEENQVSGCEEYIDARFDHRRLQWETKASGESNQINGREFGCSGRQEP
jgi:hypothetical protein